MSHPPAPPPAWVALTPGAGPSKIETGPTWAPDPRRIRVSTSFRGSRLGGAPVAPIRASRIMDPPSDWSTTRRLPGSALTPSTRSRPKGRMFAGSSSARALSRRIVPRSTRARTRSESERRGWGRTSVGGDSARWRVERLTRARVARVRAEVEGRPLLRGALRTSGGGAVAERGPLRPPVVREIRRGGSWGRTPGICQVGVALFLTRARRFPGNPCTLRARAGARNPRGCPARDRHPSVTASEDGARVGNMPRNPSGGG